MAPRKPDPHMTDYILAVILVSVLVQLTIAVTIRMLRKRATFRLMIVVTTRPQPIYLYG